MKKKLAHKRRKIALAVEKKQGLFLTVDTPNRGFHVTIFHVKAHSKSGGN